jgi:2-dehydropantoate 2-reductase
LLILFTKAYDTPDALGFAAPVIAANTTVLTLQNGLGNYEVLATRVPLSKVLAGSTSSGATLTGPGEVRVVAIGEAVLGNPAGKRERAEEVAGMLSDAHLPTRVTDNVDAALWRKAIINAAINPLGALTRCLNGELLEVPALRTLLGRVAEETYAVALALGLPLENMEPVAMVEQVCEDTAANQCSMLQDVLTGRRTEIQQINGEIARRAQAAGIAAPLNEALVALVEGLS